MRGRSQHPIQPHSMDHLASLTSLSPFLSITYTHIYIHRYGANPFSRNLNTLYPRPTYICISDRYFRFFWFTLSPLHRAPRKLLYRIYVISWKCRTKFCHTTHGFRRNRVWTSVKYIWTFVEFQTREEWIINWTLLYARKWVGNVEYISFIGHFVHAKIIWKWNNKYNKYKIIVIK